MHRFLEYRNLGDARLALKSDGTLWVLSGTDGRNEFLVDRGRGWVRARRIRLCRGDRLRVGDSEFSAQALCALFGIETPAAGGSVHPSRIPGLSAPEPVRVPADVLDKPRRNPGTGQIEHLQKEQR